MSFDTPLSDPDTGDSLAQAQRRRHRDADDPCRSPNQLVGRLAAGAVGALTVSISPDGLHMAVACVEQQLAYPIKIYSMKTGSLRSVLAHHTGLVYDVTWSFDSSTYASATLHLVALWHDSHE